ncbi:MAG: hypothetical protein J0H46_18520 [Bacteroidetes bacterium]|nr:hypothetical protein [Bacteroidota bacterium]
MEINWKILALVAIVVVALFYFILTRNKKDRKELEEELNEDYPHPRDEGEKV